MARFSYRTSFVAAALTYGIVVYKTQKARAKTGTQQPGVIGLLSDENVQYLCKLALAAVHPNPEFWTQKLIAAVMALVWLLSPQYPLALLPYAVYSVFHVATYTRANLIPVITPPPPAADASSPRPKVNSPLADRIGAFVKEYYDSSMAIVASLEILLWFRILLSAILFQSKSWLIFTVYTAFLRARYSQSTHVQTSFAQLGARVESLVGAQGTPPAARQVWDNVKNISRQFRDATDLSKYIGGAGPAKKTS